MSTTQPEKRPEGILQNIVTYLCFKSRYNSARKLTKLVYLVDVYHYDLFGRRLTDVPFKHYLYGAWAPDIAEAEEELCEAGILKEEVIPTTSGYHATVPRPLVEGTMIDLPDSALQVLEMVIEDWGCIFPDAVVAFTKRTLPFLNTPFGEPIDFSRIDPATEYARQHGISEEEAATELVIADSFLVQQVLEGDRSLCAGGRLFTHSEVFGAQECP